MMNRSSDKTSKTSNHHDEDDDMYDRCGVRSTIGNVKYNQAQASQELQGFQESVYYDEEDTSSMNPEHAATRRELVQQEGLMDPLAVSTASDGTGMKKSSSNKIAKPSIHHDDEPMWERHGVRGTIGTSKYSQTKETQKAEGVLESAYDEKAAAYSGSKMMKPHQYDANRHHQLLQQSLMDSFDAYSACDSVAVAAGAVAVGPEGEEVQRGRNADNVSGQMTPQQQRQPSNDDPDDDDVLIEAHLADPAADWEEQMAQIHQELALFRHAEVADVVVTDANNDKPQVNHNGGGARWNHHRKCFILVGIAVIVAIAAIVGVAIGLSSGGGNSSDTKEASGLVMSLFGVTTEFDEEETDLWIKVTKSFVEDFYNTRQRRGLSPLLRNLQGTNIQNVETTLEVTNTRVVQDGYSGADFSLQVMYNQKVTYASDQSSDDVSMRVLVTEPFKASARRSQYVDDLQSAGVNAGNSIFENLVAVSDIVTVIPADWQSLGQALHGHAENDNFGESVSLSRDGTVMAVGAPHGTVMAAGAPQSIKPGYAIVHQYNQNTRQWSSIGQELVGQADGDKFGESVSLNGDGTVLAVGATHNDSGEKDAGQVRVFEYNSALDRWEQLGNDINGQHAGGGLGYSVSLSDAGDVLAVGAWYDTTEIGANSGSVRLFQYDRSQASWNQLGQMLIGRATDEQFGCSVSLSQSGTIVGIGARLHDSGGRDVGDVSVFEYNSSSARWDPLGDPINGKFVNGHFGTSVSLDDSGLIMAVSNVAENENDQSVFIYVHDRSTSKWSQHGQALQTQQPGDEFGYSVSLSRDGRVVAVGSRGHNSNGFTNAGQVRIYQFDMTTNEWKQVGDALNGEAELDVLGWSVSLSADGRVVASGAVWTDANGNASGSAYSFTVDH